jgi:PKHD-type hydroxylase
MINTYQIFTKAFNDQFCDHIINTAMLYPEQGGIVGTGETSRTDTGIRRSEIRWIDVYAHREINTILNDYVNAVNSKMFGFDIAYGFDSLQYTEYNGNGEVKGFYGWHMDCLHDQYQIHDRKVSAVVQLCNPEDYEGGIFEMDGVARPEFDVSKFMPRGSLLIFPSYLQHRVTPVTKGVRKSLVTWYNGPRFK